MRTKQCPCLLVCVRVKAEAPALALSIALQSRLQALLCHVAGTPDVTPAIQARCCKCFARSPRPKQHELWRTSIGSPKAFASPEFVMATQANLKLRQLEAGDDDKGFLNLLAQLTVVGEISKEQFRERFRLLQSKQPDYHIVVLEDVDKQKIVASATLLIEYKILRHCGKVGHVEDVVVDDGYRGQKMGQRVIAALVAYAQSQGCYKVILDCSDSNAPFYEKCGFTRKEVQMAMYMSAKETS